MKYYNNWRDLRKELLKDPEVKAEYDRLEPEYRLIRQVIANRLKKGYSQAQLAAKIKTKQSAISRLESGGYNPSLNFLNKVSVALGCKLNISLT
ncbi:MAG: helix-turn-helix domain-containing protein [Candidatus Amesbacteria bacterium]|nr:helix-turn-helix domain-containing protein [Candidatus Amesbacteria bacterium]